MTLIELILVMALLVITLTVTTPALSNFFRGRRSQEEARRLLALTRFARSEAISRGTTLELWINPQLKAYGLKPLSIAADENMKLREYQLADRLEFDIDSRQLDNRGLGIILYLPDGTIDEGSPDAIGIKESAEGGVMLERAAVGEGYIIR